MNAIITTRIVAQIQAGKTINEAIDAVFGPGAYIKMAGQIYDALRAAK